VLRTVRLTFERNGSYPPKADICTGDVGLHLLGGRSWATVLFRHRPFRRRKHPHQCEHWEHSRSFGWRGGGALRLAAL